MTWSELGEESDANIQALHTGLYWQFIRGRGLATFLYAFLWGQGWELCACVRLENGWASMA